MSPLEQFKVEGIIRIGNKYIDMTITNNIIYMIIGIIIIYGNIRISKRIKQRRKGGVIYKGYKTVERTMREMIPLGYRRYIPGIMGIMTIVTTMNIVGIVPYSKTVTAEMIIVGTMSMTIMIGVTIIGVKKHKGGFIKIFIPKGIEGGMRVIIPIIFTIEVISYMIRVISLGVRIGANMMSGHALIKIIGNYGYMYTKKIPILLIIPIGILVGIYLLEIGVGIIQGYVFTLLTATYIKDVEEMH